MENRRSAAELPDVIIQHIQSFLKPNKAAETILISKSWLRAWSTRPFLHFRLLYDSYPDDVIDRTLEKYIDLKLPIFGFHIYVHAEINPKGWLKKLQQINVLELDITASFNSPSSLLQQIFQTKSLQVLKLESTCFPFFFLRTYHIKCVNLKKLELCNMQINEIAFRHIMCSCPLMEELLLQSCTFKDIWCLENRSFMFASECASLKRLLLIGTEIYKNERLQTILSKSPVLEELSIIDSKIMLVKPVNLSSVSLKRVNLDSILLQSVLIDAPNLQELKFSSSKFWPISKPVTITSPVTTKGTVKVTIVYDDREVNETWFHWLRISLVKFSNANAKFISHFNLRLTFDFLSEQVLATIPVRMQKPKQRSSMMFLHLNLDAPYV